MNAQLLRIKRPLLGSALLLALGIALPASGAKPEFPQLDLPEVAMGQRAIDLLGENLPAVAKWYGKTPGEFAAILRRDNSARLDRSGRLHYVETFTVEQVPPAKKSGDPEAAAFPLDQTLQLHSRPGAQRTIYLDFTGHTSTNTAWNNYVGMASIESPPFDIDGIPFSFSQTELDRIQRIWQRVAEDYAPFDVDVTTEEPPADALVRSSSSDQVFGTRVVITRDFVPGGCGCGGFAYVGVFDMTSEFYKPAYVFYDRLGNGHDKYVGEAVTHEAGHNLGLNHDGSSTSGYYTGHGSGETGWAPIMGVGYYQSLVQWSKGEYDGANNREDDFLVMQANALPLREDDHGDSPATATALAGGQTLAGGGVIERRSDADLFKFAADAGVASFALSFDNPSPNLDSLLELLDASQTVLASSNPSSALASSVSATLPAAGTYYLRVSGVGKGSVLSDGYSDYGSLGEYRLAGSVQQTGNQPPVAVAGATPSSGTAPLAVNLSANGSSDPDRNIVSWVWDLGDGSPTVNAQSVQHVYSQGTRVATLTVTDDQGLSDSDSVTIEATAPVSATVLHVESIDVSLEGNRRSTRATATVEVRDDSGNPVAGALVNARWSGVVSGTGSATTDSAGIATLRSPRSRDAGTFAIVVLDVQLSGYAYDENLNTETSDSASN